MTTRHPLPAFDPILDWWKRVPGFSKLPSSALYVLFSLLKHRDHTKQIGRIGNARLQRETSYSERAVRMAMRRLESIYLVKCWYTSDGRRSTRYYHLAMNEDAFKRHCIQSVGCLAVQQGGKVSTTNRSRVALSIRGQRIAPPQGQRIAPLSDVKVFR